MHSYDARRHEYKAAPVIPPAHKLQCSEIQTASVDSIIERHICKEERGWETKRTISILMPALVPTRNRKNLWKDIDWKMSALVQAKKERPHLVA